MTLEENPVRDSPPYSFAACAKPGKHCAILTGQAVGRGLRWALCAALPGASADAAARRELAWFGAP